MPENWGEPPSEGERSAPLTAEGRVMRARAEVERAEAEELATWKAAKRAEQAADQARKQLREAELELELEREHRGERLAERLPAEPDWFRPRGAWDADEPEHALVEAGGSAPAPESPAAKTFDDGLPRAEERRVDAHAFEIPLFPPRDEDPLPPAFDLGALSEPDGGRAFEIPFVPDADKIGRYEPEEAGPETAPEPPHPPLGTSVYESLVAETGAHLPASLDAEPAPSGNGDSEASPDAAPSSALAPIEGVQEPSTPVPPATAATGRSAAIEAAAPAEGSETAPLPAPTTPAESFDFASVAVPPFDIPAPSLPAPAPLDLPAPAVSALPTAPPPAGPASTLPPPPGAAPAVPPFSFAAPFIPGGPAQPPAPPSSGPGLADVLAAAPPPQVEEQPEAKAERPAVPGFYEPPVTESVIQAPQWETPTPTPGLYEPPATTVPSVPVAPAESGEPKVPGWHEPYPSAPVIRPKWGDD